jgi:tetratricopeptide (TPR) repeat protein
MQTRHYLITAIVGILGVAGGFLLANKLNRSEFERMRAESGSVTVSSNTNADLSSEEIDQKLTEARESPDDLQFQKRLGISLYRFGTMKREAATIEKALGPLKRANEIDPDDKEVVSTLGNAYFDIGYFKKDNDSLEKSREFYELLLKARPDDTETRTDLGLTYFLTDPPDLEEAARHFEMSLGTDPNHEKTLQFYIQTLAKLNRLDKAKTVLAKLREVNPRNPAISELAAFIENPTQQ